MGSAGLSSEIKIANPLERSIVADLGVAAMGGVIRGRIDVENLAIQLISDSARYAVQQSYANSSVSDEYHQSQRASRGEGHITQTTVDQQWESHLINDAEFTANAPLPSVTLDVNNSYVSQQLGQQIGEEVSHFYHPTPPPARNPSGFWQRVEQRYKNSFERQALIAEGRAAAYSEVIRESVGHEAANQQNYLDLGYSESNVETRVAEWMSPIVISASPAVIKLPIVAAKAYSLMNRWGLFGKQVVPENTLRQRVLGNIAESQAASKTSNFLALSAKENQMLAGYNSDAWSMINLRKGDVVYGGIPGQSAYYTSEKTILASGFNKDALFQSLQVRANPIFGYRSEVGVYEVTKDIRVPYGIVSSNPGLGAGTGEQFFINNFSNALRLVDRIELEETYNYDMSTFRPRP